MSQTGQEAEDAVEATGYHCVLDCPHGSLSLLSYRKEQVRVGFLPSIST